MRVNGSSFRNDSRSNHLFFTIPIDVLAIALGCAAALWRPSPQWVEQRFINGYYPGWERFWSSLTPLVPFSLGDAAVIAGALAILGTLVLVRPFWRAAVRIAAIAGLYAFWFYAGWGFGYNRAPLESRAQFEGSRINPGAIDALRQHVIDRMNRLAPLAHRTHAGNVAQDDALRAAWLPVVQRVGNDWAPRVAPAKPTLAGWFMDRSGTSGFTNPFTLETQLAPDLLWFERPFSQAHEWSHVAGFNREDEANYIAVVTCMRDGDPVAQYSGVLELFLYLPPLKHYTRSTFVPQVWADFNAIRRRNAHFVNLNLSRFSWRVYNNYLKSNHVVSGVENYDEVTRLVAGIPLDAQGLPRSRRAARPGASAFRLDIPR